MRLNSMRLKMVPLTLVATAAIASAASPAPSPKSVASPTTGTASFYSTRYDGRITAGGQRFRSNAFTAASRDLPFGTRVKLTNLSNHRHVVVRVNDRGPFVKGREISVTRSAAQRLGFVKAGTAQVSIEPIAKR